MKSHIKVRLLGGIGNQLFGVFFGMAVNSYLKTDFYADDELIKLGSNQKRKLEIDKLKFEPLNPIFIKREQTKSNPIYKIKFFRKISWYLLSKSKIVIKENALNKKNFYFKIGQTFVGYFQDWFYADLVHELNPNLKLQMKNPGQDYLESVSDLLMHRPICIHVRLGDYLDFPELYPKLPEYYYLESIIHLSSGRKEQVWVFTEELSKLEFYYPNLFDLSDRIIDQDSIFNDLESFLLLAQSDKLVTSNSTYSLWAAWFAEKNGAKVVIPLEMGIKGSGLGLSSSRWDRYDLNRKAIIQKTIEKETYNLKKREFESKFR
jgi:hypothetical protein